MSEAVKEPGRVFLAMPGYGSMTAAAARAFWFACRERKPIHSYKCGSLLAANFNMLWCEALNMQRDGVNIEYFAMLHDDMGARDFWLDTLIEELEAEQLDMLGVVAPIKDGHGLTSIALASDDDSTWHIHGRLTMEEIHQLPETFTSHDTGRPILLNTGCWVIRFDPAYTNRLHFTINDRIVFNKATDRYEVEVESEDWYFSRLAHENNLRIGATRKVPVAHRGAIDFGNELPWGDWSYDKEHLQASSLPQLENPISAAEPALALSEV